jgi:ubiquinone/menaquinone biosynthesis C-methylase UbiE
MPDICSYEGSDYRKEFWGKGDRTYEDLAERIAIRRLLPPKGSTLIEFGAGFGRLADLYSGYKQVMLLDYAKTMLADARELWGHDPRFTFVAADIYRLPLKDASFQAAVIVRVIHHIQDVPLVLTNIRKILADEGVFILEHANKRNLKAIARYILGKQSWSPFDREPVEFVPLNYDFHPAWMREKLVEAGFSIEDQLSVSHFRHRILKRTFSPQFLAKADGAVQRLGAIWKLTPSMILKCTPSVKTGTGAPAEPLEPEEMFKCPVCGGDLQSVDGGLKCGQCGRVWPLEDGIYNFRVDEKQ